MKLKENSFVFRGEEVLIPEMDGIELPRGLDYISTGKVDGVGTWRELHVETDLKGWRAVPRKGLWELIGEISFAKANRLYAEMDWRKNSRFCGRCGTPMKDGEDNGRVCPKCGYRIYPIISPAVIVAVERGNRILLAHNSAFPSGRYSVLAGFVDLGESLEETLKREIREEVGIEISDISYFDSQSWPFPRSLMVAFQARWASGEIEVDGKEIDSAGWFAPEDLPEIPGSVSVSRRLIDDFIRRNS